MKTPLHVPNMTDADCFNGFTRLFPMDGEKMKRNRLLRIVKASRGLASGLSHATFIKSCASPVCGPRLWDGMDLHIVGLEATFPAGYPLWDISRTTNAHRRRRRGFPCDCRPGRRHEMNRLTLVRIGSSVLTTSLGIPHEWASNRNLACAVIPLDMRDENLEKTARHVRRLG